MKNKINPQEFGYATLLGFGVLIGAPLIGHFVEGIHSFFAIAVPLTSISIGSVIGAGVSAFGIDLAIDKWLR